MKLIATMDDPALALYQGDCREVFQSVHPAQLDLCIADPPFNQGEPYAEWDDSMGWADYWKFTDEWLAACVDRLAPHGGLWVNCPDSIAAEVVTKLKALGLVMINWCVWTFRFGVCHRGAFINGKTHALYFARSRKDRRWNPDAVLVPSDRATKYADKRTQASATPGKRVPLDVWGSEGDGGEGWGRVQGNNRERRKLHPNQLPELYLERIVKACSDPGDLVADPFLGSGTTAVVARALGRRFVGCDVSEEYVRSAADRVRAGAVRTPSTEAKDV